MRAVALISGGKDSCYNMMQCIAAGHTIVALANIQPSNQDELDSYMYQTVGHQGIDLYAKAMDLPLYRSKTKGIALQTEKQYTPTDEDEVEDLYNLLSRIKEEIQFDAVAVGAILSDYQRIRVENVCSRLGLISLAYLWRRNQVELLQEMILSGLEAIVIKVAALGLDPALHLGKTIKELQPHLLVMQDKYGLNVCGEGGEYETFTLDCPLFKRKLVIDEKELIMHSDDPIAPVGYLNLNKFHLEDKPNFNESIQLPRSVKNAFDFVNDLSESVYSDMSDIEMSETEIETIERLENTNADEDTTLNSLVVNYSDDNFNTKLDLNQEMPIKEEIRLETPDDVVKKCLSPHKLRIRTESGDMNLISMNLSNQICYESENIIIEDASSIYGNNSGWYFIGGIVGEGQDSEEATSNAMDKLSNLLESEGLQTSDICSVNLYIRDMGDYATINRVYSVKFNFPNPPTRVCVQCPLPSSIGLIMDAVAFKNTKDHIEANKRTTMHVQGISHWAPANIGPYSQAIKVGEIMGTCGQIALVPGAMKLVCGGARRQCSLALRHLGRVLRALHPRANIRSALQGVCYVTAGGAVCDARRQWERRTAGAIVDYVVVPALPRDATVEWHVWAHTNNNSFDYEETGCNVNEYKVAIRRRWNYENTVAAIVCYVATGSSPSTSQLSFSSDEAQAQHRALASHMSKEELIEVLEYALKKLLNDCTEREPEPAVSLRIFYQVSISPPVSKLIEGLRLVRAKLCPKLAFTVVPVVMLQNAFTFISICATRHAE